MGGAPSSIKQPDELENPGQVLQGNVSIEGMYMHIHISYILLT